MSHWQVRDMRGSQHIMDLLMVKISAHTPKVWTCFSASGWYIEADTAQLYTD